jgi:hypothetical protein
MTVDDVLADLKVRFEADIQQALDEVAAGDGTVAFAIGINRVSKDELDAKERDEAVKPDALYATIKDLQAKVAALEEVKS